MKKSFNLGKVGVLSLVLSAFLITCGVLVYAAGSSLDLGSFRTGSLEKTTKGNAKLTEDKWNDLMAALENGGGTYETIPDGMIAAFDGDCPSGWSLFSTATVPGGTAPKKWCQKGELTPQPKISFTTIATRLNTYDPYLENAWYAIGKTSETVQKGTYVYAPCTRAQYCDTQGINIIKVGGNVYTVPLEKTLYNGETYEFVGLNNKCHQPVDDDCEIEIRYRQTS